MFGDRHEAGCALAPLLPGYANRNDVLVLALPRGGVPVAFEVARALRAPLDVFVVRKLGMPGQEEFAIGAIASGDVRVLNERVIQLLDLQPAEVEAVIRSELRELARREQLYRGDRAALDVSGRTVILVDDGLATGSTMQAAIKALRQLAPARLVVAVPVAPAEVCATLRPEVEELVCARMPVPFTSVGQWYDDFAQTSDAEVRELLDAARDDGSPAGAGTSR
jgi:predicted phosphoribosyltransferase